MIAPHGSEKLNPLYVADDAQRAELIEEAQNLPSIIISSGAASSAVMLGSGYFNPLTGYMNIPEAISVAENMVTPDGLFWPVPIMNIVKADQLATEARDASRIALRDPNVDDNPVLAIMDVSGIEVLTAAQKGALIEHTFCTTDPEHPGVAAFSAMGDRVISGQIQVLNFSYFRSDFADTFRSAPEDSQGYCKSGLEQGCRFSNAKPHAPRPRRIMPHCPESGRRRRNPDSHAARQIKTGGHSGSRARCINSEDGRAIFSREHRFRNRVRLRHALRRATRGAPTRRIPPELRLLGSDRRARSRRCWRLLPGPFDAQTIFDEIPENALEIEIFRGDHTVWCNKCDEIVMMRDCPHAPR